MTTFPRTAEEILADYEGRKAGLVRALTEGAGRRRLLRVAERPRPPPPHPLTPTCPCLNADVDEFYAACDPLKENLCLYGAWAGSGPLRFPQAARPVSRPTRFDHAPAHPSPTTRPSRMSHRMGAPLARPHPPSTKSSANDIVASRRPAGPDLGGGHAGGGGAARAAGAVPGHQLCA